MSPVALLLVRAQQSWQLSCCSLTQPGAAHRPAAVQSYSGGKDIWGLHDKDGMASRPEETEKGFRKPIYDDELLEVIGLKSGWHTCALRIRRCLLVVEPARQGGHGLKI